MAREKVYTRVGDDGTTGLFYGGRVNKDSALPRAYGAVDEAQAILGLVRAEAGTQEAAQAFLNAASAAAQNARAVATGSTSRCMSSCCATSPTWPPWISAIPSATTCR